MPPLYPEIEPYAHGMLPVGDGNAIYWETCGNPQGKPAVVLHGGPGSGCGPRARRLFDPSRYRIVQFDQRGCGRSIPHASSPDTSLVTNTTQHLIDDIERLREHLNIEQWLVFGGSWGSTLALAYAESHAPRVTEMVLWGVTTGRHSEFDWLFRGGVAVFFPEQWDRFCAAIPDSERTGDIVADYARRLHHPDPLVRQETAAAWCRWESVTPDWPPRQGLSPRFQDPVFALAFARIVTHYVSHYAWLDDGLLLKNAGVLTAIPGILINGRFDLQAPLANAWALKRVWPHAELVVVENAGHSPDAPGITEAMVRAADQFATR
jgi:proline iminopeptidase